MIKFYCYARCSTCKKAKKHLDEQNVQYDEVEIKEHDLTPADLKVLHERSGKPIKRLFNTSGQLYRELNIKDRIETMDENEIYQLLASDGMLIKRPILISDQQVLFGYKEEEYQEVIDHVKGNK